MRRTVNGWTRGLWGQRPEQGVGVGRGQGKVAFSSGDKSAVPGNVRIGQGSSSGHSLGPVSLSAKRGKQPVSHLPSQVVLRLRTCREGSQSCRGRAKRWALGPWGGRPRKKRGALCPSALSHFFSRAGRAQLCLTPGLMKRVLCQVLQTWGVRATRLRIELHECPRALFTW